MISLNLANMNMDMKVVFEDREVSLGAGIDISMEVGNPNKYMRAWYLSEPTIEPVRMGDFVGSVQEGSSVNFMNIQFNPHAHGTHTESYGHITKEFYSVNEIRLPLLMKCALVTISGEQIGEDRVVGLDQMKAALAQMEGEIEALVLRTRIHPEEENIQVDFSETNPTFVDASVADFLVERGINHFLIDLPSVDKEKDGGSLSFHHAFWQIPESPRKEATITEFVNIPAQIKDGLYALNLQVSAFHNDAAPSRPVLYSLD